MTAWNGHAPLARRLDCTLYPAKGGKRVHSAGIRNTYWGVCRREGLEQEQRFVGTFADVQKRFFVWAEGMPQTMEIVKPEKARKKEEPEMATEAEQKERKMPEKLYALAYKHGSASKYVMAFADMDAAMDAADVAGKALEIAGVDGEYTVDELPVRWK